MASRNQDPPLATNSSPPNLSPVLLVSMLVHIVHKEVKFIIAIILLDSCLSALSLLIVCLLHLDSDSYLDIFSAPTGIVLSTVLLDSFVLNGPVITCQRNIGTLLIDTD